MQRRASAALLLSLTLVAACASTAAAQPHAHGGSVSALFTLGMGGKQDTDPGVGGLDELDLDAGLGIDLRAEADVLDFLAVGGHFGFMRIRPEDLQIFVTVEIDPATAIDMGPYARLHYAFRVGRDVVLDPYLLLPFGFTLGVPNEDAQDAGVDTGFGFHLATLLGIAIQPTERGFVSLEVGFTHRHTWHDAPGDDVDVTVNHASLHIGGGYRF